jgi:hypothetical protein
MRSAHSLDETLHRLAKRALDSGAASSLVEADAILRGYRLHFHIDDAEAGDELEQATLLTGVALARRVFLGGVSVGGALDVPLRVPVSLGASLRAAITALGAVATVPTEATPTVFIGGGARPHATAFQLRTVCAGWRGGVLPAHSSLAPAAGPRMHLAPMLSAALAVNEAFAHVSGESATAGRVAVGMSLWRPGAEVDWLVGPGDEPYLRYLPQRLWLIGLGHLGQAYLWALGLLPYEEPSAVSLVLQDIDVITPSTESTSILTDANMVGLKKTRAMSAWAERRGFGTVLHERRFDDSFRRQSAEPSIALCGLDNALGRRALDRVGFELVVEAGLGRGYRDFRCMRLHTLPGPRPASEMWKEMRSEENVVERIAYADMLAKGVLDRCGVTLLAGKAIGAPFVGSVAAALALGEVLRLLHGGPLHQLIDLDLESLEHRTVVRHPTDFGNLNPGYVSTRC